jgi:hypothetical protein
LHIKLRSIIFLISIHVQVLHARKPRLGYRIYFRPQVKCGEDRVINLLRQGRKELHNEGLANVTITIKGSKRLIMRETCSFHWNKGKLYSITAILYVPVFMVFQNKAVVLRGSFQKFCTLYVSSLKMDLFWWA